MYRRGFLVAVVATTGCLEAAGDNGEEVTDPTDIVIVSDGLGREDTGTEDERVYVWGVARNEDDRDLSYVEIRATFLDADGKELDSVIEHVEDVTSGQEWAFEIEYPHFGEDAADVDDYELEPTTGL
ncbi:FxLYD domain-containing protein [Natrialbaceae archaeon AArc-T1-2]|uniref:FxLYD domain-containing protein n=1 Tax=Natrialbaceae archaeon AArc-T1-2 TaxID=3053904 RepID=UPI00255A758A|nr:FxLYD domain-containing protein [Natrialbaceae archaeon AArc-T1-2]WIV67170.1 FxLYD domain-containing protein [Natrialbaceae archaeon AArc-T1-2]